MNDYEKTKRAEQAVADLLTALYSGRQWREDENLAGTPQRVAKMFLGEVCGPLSSEAPRIASFSNDTHILDQLYTVGPISVRSLCAHHLAPVMGQAWVGVYPGSSVLGLSKFTRLTRWVMGRPILQEAATVMLADKLEEAIKPKGIAVAVRASHLCMTWRGVKEEQGLMTTTVVRGELRDNASMKQEFFTMIQGQGF